MVKKTEPKSVGKHITSIDKFKSDMLGNIFESSCTCGWMLRYYSLSTAEMGARSHEEDPTPYPSVIHQIKANQA
jgi:hypothetical protein